METEGSFIRIAKCILESFKMVFSRETENSLAVNSLFMKGNGIKVRGMAWVKNNYQMALFLLALLKTI